VSVVVPVVRAVPGFAQPISSLLHLCAAGIALVGAAPLIKLGNGSSFRRWSLRVYTTCVVANLAISGVYHALSPQCEARAVLQRFDHFAVWLLIAGTFTAVHGVACRGFWRGGVLALAWAYAACGVILQVCCFRVFGSRPGLVLYLGFGWLGVVSIVKIGREVGHRAVRPIWFAGLAYTAGALLEQFCRQKVFVHNWVGAHEVFHLAVVIGVALHWRCVRQLLIHFHHRPAMLAQLTANQTAGATTSRPTRTTSSGLAQGLRSTSAPALATVNTTSTPPTAVQGVGNARCQLISANAPATASAKLTTT
jgi:channel protein (hemolysin III family)